VLCFGAEAADYRTEAFAPYHADRPPMPDELERQWADAAAFFGAFGWTILHTPELEADDLLGSLAKIEAEAGGDALLFTGDRDMFQCVGERVTVLFPRGGKDGPEVIGPDEVRERYGIEPEQVTALIALRGDPSDNIPGAPGIGQKTAAELLRRYGDLEGVIAHAAELTPRLRLSVEASADDLRRYLEVAAMRRDVPIAIPADTALDRESAAQWCREAGMTGLATRLTS
jgi:DNA polymerase-1